MFVRFVGGAAAVKLVSNEYFVEDSGLPTLFVAAGCPRAAHQESGHRAFHSDFCKLFGLPVCFWYECAVRTTLVIPTRPFPASLIRSCHCCRFVRWLSWELLSLLILRVIVGGTQLLCVWSARGQNWLKSSCTLVIYRFLGVTGLGCTQSTFADRQPSSRAVVLGMGASRAGPPVVFCLGWNSQCVLSCFFGLCQSHFHMQEPCDLRNLWLLIALSHGRLRPHLASSRSWPGFRGVQKGLPRALPEGGIDHRSLTLFGVMSLLASAFVPAAADLWVMTCLLMEALGLSSCSLLASAFVPASISITSHV